MTNTLTFGCCSTFPWGKYGAAKTRSELTTEKMNFSKTIFLYRLLLTPKQSQIILNRNKTGSSQVGAISKAQKYSRNNYWKHLQKINFFQNNFFCEKFFRNKSHNAEKLKKRPFRLIKRFYKPKTSKKCKGYPLIESVNFRKKSRIVPKKNQTKKTKRNKPLVSHLLLEA